MGRIYMKPYIEGTGLVEIDLKIEVIRVEMCLGLFMAMDLLLCEKPHKNQELIRIKLEIPAVYLRRKIHLCWPIS